MCSLTVWCGGWWRGGWWAPARPYWIPGTLALWAPGHRPLYLGASTHCAYSAGRESSQQHFSLFLPRTWKIKGIQGDKGVGTGPAAPSPPTMNIVPQMSADTTLAHGLGSTKNTHVSRVVFFWLSQWQTKYEIWKLLTSCLWERIVNNSFFLSPCFRGVNRWLLAVSCHCFSYTQWKAALQSCPTRAKFQWWLCWNLPFPGEFQPVSDSVPLWQQNHHHSFHGNTHLLLFQYQLSISCVFLQCVCCSSGDMAIGWMLSSMTASLPSMVSWCSPSLPKGMSSGVPSWRRPMPSEPFTHNEYNKELHWDVCLFIVCILVSLLILNPKKTETLVTWIYQRLGWGGGIRVLIYSSKICLC